MIQTPTTASRPRRYEELRDSAARALLESRFHQALERFERACEVAIEEGDDEGVYRAFANKTTAAFVAGARLAASTASSLRQGLTRSRNPGTRYLLAKALANFYANRSALRKSLFYARTARQMAPPEYRASGEHLLGVTLLAASRSREALPHLLWAHDRWPGNGTPLALSTSGLAYDRALDGDRAGARHWLRESRRLLRGESAGRIKIHDAAVLLNSGFALQEIGEREEALLDAEATVEHLRTIEAVPCHEHKMALYLAGEAAADLGRAQRRDNYFAQLLQIYYPDHWDLRGLLQAVRTTGLVNWMA